MREAEKRRELAPYIEAAFKRKQWMKPIKTEDIPLVESYGRRKDIEISVSKSEVLGERGGGFSIPSSDPHAGKLKPLDLGGRIVVDPHEKKV